MNSKFLFKEAQKNSSFSDLGFSILTVNVLRDQLTNSFQVSNQHVYTVIRMRIQTSKEEPLDTEHSDI